MGIFYLPPYEPLVANAAKVACVGSETVVVKIVDVCLLSLRQGTIDMTPEAYQSMADHSNPPLNTNIQYQQYVTFLIPRGSPSPSQNV
ncbi:hypothetical protein NL676_033038 [Syzygium grande]|nr:hypothetical protein NL676_033038 [Syzygium grande]